VSTTGWWILGFAVAGAVVLIAATLLITIILLARRIVSQTAAITFALDGAMRNTNPLFDLASVNHGLESISRGLGKLRGEPKGIEDERNLLDRMRSHLPGRGG
jgi:hypothetical protein